MTSYVENETEMTFPFDCREILESVMEEVLTSENCPYEAQVNLLITDNDGIQEYNRQFRDKDMPTDVLSFPMIPFRTEADFSVAEEAEADYFDPDSGSLSLEISLFLQSGYFSRQRALATHPKENLLFLQLTACFTCAGMIIWCRKRRQLWKRSRKLCLKNWE